MVGYNRALLRPKGLVMTHIETIFGPHGPIQAYMGPARAATVRQNHFRNYIFPFFSFLNYISPMYLPTGSPQNICVTTMLTNADSLSPSEISSFFFSLDSVLQDFGKEIISPLHFPASEHETPGRSSFETIMLRSGFELA